MNQKNSIRVNIIVRDDPSLKISITTNTNTTIAKLKRTIESQLHELHGIHLLVSVIEDQQSFVLSNNSIVSDHLQHGDTIYIQTHKNKYGNNMNLPAKLTDLFLTMRYVNCSVVQKLLDSQNQMNALEVVPEIVHLGFWYSNGQTVLALSRLLNKVFRIQTLEAYGKQSKELQNLLLLKLVYFWVQEVKESFAVYPDIMEELLMLLEKLSSSAFFVELLKGHKIVKSIVSLSKEALLDKKMKNLIQKIIKNLNGRGGSKSKNTLAFTPDTLSDSTTNLVSVDQLAQMLGNGSQDDKKEALQTLAQQPKVMNQLTVRFDHYSKATGLFLMRNVQDKVTSRMFSQVVRNLTSHTTRQKAVQIIQRDLIRKVHNFLLDSHIDSHQSVFQYYAKVAKQSASQGLFNVQQASEVLTSPYPPFQRITCEAIADMSQKKVSPIRFLPSIKQYIRLALKTQDLAVAASLMRAVSNLTLDEQCRYQIVNLKGIEVLSKLIQIGSSKNQQQLQRACAKGLLNLSISSRDNKAKVLGLIHGVLELYYKGKIESVAGSYLQNILKATS